MKVTTIEWKTRRDIILFMKAEKKFEQQYKKLSKVINPLIIKTTK